MTDYQKGLWITLCGVLVLIPDSVLLRFVQEEHFIVVLAYRGICAGLTLHLYFVFFSKRSVRDRLSSLSREHIAMCLLMAMSQSTFIMAVHHTTVANALFLLSTSPVFAALLSGIILRERIAALTWLTIGFVLLGISVIAYPHLITQVLTQGIQFSLWGDVAALSSSITLAIIFCLSRRLKGRGIVETVAMSSYLAGFVALLFAPTLGLLSFTHLLVILLLGCVVTPVGYSLLNIGPKFLPAPEVGLLLLLETLCAPLLVWLLFAEYPGNYTLIGGLIIVLAIGGSTLYRLIYSPKVSM